MADRYFLFTKNRLPLQSLAISGKHQKNFFRSRNVIISVAVFEIQDFGFDLLIKNPLQLLRNRQVLKRLT